MPAQCNRTEIIVRAQFDPETALFNVEERCTDGSIDMRIKRYRLTPAGRELLNKMLEVLR